MPGGPPPWPMTSPSPLLDLPGKEPRDHSALRGKLRRSTGSHSHSHHTSRLVDRLPIEHRAAATSTHASCLSLSSMGMAAWTHRVGVDGRHLARAAVTKTRQHTSGRAGARKGKPVTRRLMPSDATEMYRPERPRVEAEVLVGPVSKGGAPLRGPQPGLRHGAHDS